jgi:hypothetical protein
MRNTISFALVALFLCPEAVVAQQGWDVGISAGEAAPAGPLNDVFNTGFAVEAHALRALRGGPFSVGAQSLFAVMGNPATNGHLTIGNIGFIGSYSFDRTRFTPYVFAGPGLYETAETFAGVYQGRSYRNTGYQLNGGGIVGAGARFSAGTFQIPISASYHRVSTARADFKPVGFLVFSLGVSF